MMKWVFSGLIVLAFAFGAMNGRMNEVSNAALTEGSNAIQLMLTLAGSICLWSGLMKIATRSGLTEKISRLFSPVIGRLFDDMDPASPAAQAITLNISANLLGLGNAATPLGIMAMREMQKQNGGRDEASDNMVLFVVLNTASLQLIPTTAALLRANAGSKTPLDILPAVLISSIVSITAGVLMAKLLALVLKKKDILYEKYASKRLGRYPSGLKTLMERKR